MILSLGIIQLDSGYDVHSLVSLWPDSHNYLYVWSSKRTNITASGDYTPISSDIHVYDRETLNELAVFRHVRTGFDTTMKKSDDESTLEMGRGLVFIADGLIAYVAYDEATSKDAHASIWCIDETGSVPVSTRTISSSDIDGFDVDIESPMPDSLGGFYFVNVDMTSPDANTLISTMTLMHGTPTGSSVVCDLGSFKAPPSTFLPNTKDPQAIPERICSF